MEQEQLYCVVGTVKNPMGQGRDVERKDLTGPLTKRQADTEKKWLSSLRNYVHVTVSKHPYKAK